MAVIPAVPANLKPMTEFDACLASWMQACQKLITEGSPGSTLERVGGTKYIKFLVSKQNSGRSAYAFVDARNGNIYKAATWKAPALNHARGNILDDKNGMEFMTWVGPKYIDEM